MASSSPLVEIANSSFLDYTGYRITQLTSVENAYGISDGQLFDSADAATPFNMALVLQRQQDPSELLAQPWASRQRQLEQLRRDGNLWKRYGADQEMFAAFQNDLRETYNFKLLGDSDNYVSSPESRTVWIKIDSGKKFEDLFGTSLYYSGSQGLAYWKGNLSFPKDWVNEIAGLWPDVDTAPQASNFTPDTAATLPLGPQSPGNATAIPPSLAPQTIAASLYNFPLAGAAHATGPIGLIEPAVGTGLPKDPTGDGFATLLQEYLQAVGQTSLDGSVDVAVQGINAQSGNSSAERSIDIGIVSAVNPNSPFIFFNGSGSGTVFTAAQSAAWWGSNQQAPQVTTNSWGDSNSMTPGSPFYNAYWGIFEDAALNNQTTLIALGDGGSGNETGNGITNVEMNITQPYNLIVSGTSLSTLQSAKADPTLNGHGNLPITPLALSQDRATLWSLMQAGLSTLPNEASSADRFLEAVWNSYEVFSDGASGRYLITNPATSEFDAGYNGNSTASGGVDPSQPAPSYQLSYGLAPVSNDPLAQPGRGVPDVSANAGGNLFYSVPKGSFEVDANNQIALALGSGTSAATPFWASLVVQLNALFKDIYGTQGPNQLGYMNDLLYTASVVSPAGFNDIQIGNNTSSFYSPGSGDYISAYGNQVISLTPTNFGYQASAGYDLVSGLGSPNGKRLAIGLVNIANIQLSAAAAPPVLKLAGDGLLSGADQVLQFQVSSPVANPVTVSVANQSMILNSAASANYAWTSQLAQQTLQSSFDSALVRLFDGASQGAVIQGSAGSAAPVKVELAGAATTTPQFNLSSAYGFVDFGVSATAQPLSSYVRASRPVSVATTTNDANNADAVVRMRQNGRDSVAVFCYKVDDLTGVINGIHPGQSGYGALAQERRYQFSGGALALEGAGYGQYSQGMLQGINSGDLIAMGLINQTQAQTFYGFAQANEQVDGVAVNHIWNYGMNVFGFEDTFAAGDRDFNDAIVELDFASASGNHLLV